MRDRLNSNQFNIKQILMTDTSQRTYPSEECTGDRL